MLRSSAGARRPAVVLIVVAVVLSLAGSGLSAAGSAQNALDELIIDFQNEDSQDEQFDARSGSVAPSSAQRSVVAQLGAQVRWNRFGTPSSLIKYGGFLTTGIRAEDAVAAARAWVDANAGLFRVGSSNSFELLSSSRLQGTNGYAVNFRQVVDGVVVS